MHRDFCGRDGATWSQELISHLTGASLATSSRNRRDITSYQKVISKMTEPPRTRKPQRQRNALTLVSSAFGQIDEQGGVSRTRRLNSSSSACLTSGHGSIQPASPGFARPGSYPIYFRLLIFRRLLYVIDDKSLYWPLLGFQFERRRRSHSTFGSPLVSTPA